MLSRAVAQVLGIEADSGRPEIKMEQHSGTSSTDAEYGFLVFATATAFGRFGAASLKSLFNALGVVIRAELL